jgi:4'-phosphopantetheinyl transferase EntD
MSLIATILPPQVAAAEAVGETPEPALLPEEALVVRHALDARRREFALARMLARHALADLRCPPSAILSGAHREPLWPAGIVGSITHCAGYCAAAVARTGAVSTIGIDAEIHAPLPAGVLSLVAREDERQTRELRDGGPVHWDRLLFSAKESVFKAWFPLMRRWLGFEAVRVRFDPATQTFCASFLDERPVIDGRSVTAFEGRYRVCGTHVLTAVTL